MKLVKFPDYPPGWDTYDFYAQHLSPKEFGFSGNTGDVNRFGARYRVAKCFEDVVLKGITYQTNAGYTALIHLLLTYSSFDLFLKVLGISQKDTLALISKEEQKKILGSLHTKDQENKVFSHVYRFLSEESHKRQFRSYFQEQDCNPFFLIAGIRHVFVHGYLAPNIKGLSENVGPVVDVCDYSTKVIFQVMDREFRKKTDEFRTSHF